jgi:UDP-GlcNAc:undecaprenyl-phosphate/decaprenyl-phosphate GlcNAc-1-phosphate transferase
MRVALRTGMVDRPAQHKFHGRPTPYLGGVALRASVIAASVAGLVIAPHLRARLLAPCLGGTGVLAVGLLDDPVTLDPAARSARG